VTWETSTFGNPHQETAYRGMIHAVRDAVGHPIADGAIMETSNTGSDLLVLTIINLFAGSEGATVRLYFTAADMYLRGFESVNTHDSAGPDPRLLFQLGQLPNGDFNLGHRLGRPAAEVHTLDFDGTYPSIEHAAAESRSAAEYGLLPTQHAVSTLWDTTTLRTLNRQAVARAVLVLVTTVAEAARVEPIADGIAAAIGGGRAFALDSADRRLTAFWGQGSAWGRARAARQNEGRNFRIRAQGHLAAIVITTLAALAQRYPLIRGTTKAHTA
jgi:Ribosome inactivating protein